MVVSIVVTEALALALALVIVCDVDGLAVIVIVVFKRVDELAFVVLLLLFAYSVTVDTLARTVVVPGTMGVW